MTTIVEDTTWALTAHDSLHAASVAVKTARGAVQAAEQIANRAAEDLSRATEALKAFDSVDELFAQHRIAALKAGRWQGWPSELREKRIEKLAAIEEAEHSRRAFEALNAEVDDARGNLTIAERELDEAAASVFTARVAEVVGQLEVLNVQREYLRRVLRGAGVPFGGPGFERLAPVQRENVMADTVRGAKFPAGTLQDWREVNAAATTALMQSRLPDSEAADATARAYWQRFAAAILCDPDAEPGPLPDSDSILV